MQNPVSEFKDVVTVFSSPSSDFVFVEFTIILMPVVLYRIYCINWQRMTDGVVCPKHYSLVSSTASFISYHAQPNRT